MLIVVVLSVMSSAFALFCVAAYSRSGELCNAITFQSLLHLPCLLLLTANEWLMASCRYRKAIETCRTCKQEQRSLCIIIGTTYFGALPLLVAFVAVVVVIVVLL